MIRLACTAIIFALILTACAARNATTDVTPDAWRADLQFLARELSARHVNAFHTVSRDQFNAEVARLDQAIPQMRDEEVVVGLMRVVALIGDGHTHLDLPPSFARYPIEFHWFDNELRVLAAAHPYHAAVGTRLLGIGAASLDDLMKRTSELVPRGETDGWTRLTATLRLTSPEVLLGLNVITDRENVPFVLENDNGERVTINFSPTHVTDFSTWRMAAADNPPRYVSRLMEPWWAEFLPQSQTVYFSFSRYPPKVEFRERAAALGRLIDDSKARRLVIDLRHNEGGDFERFRQLLLPLIEDRPAINRKGGLFVIIGPGTFSAAGVNALDLRQRANAILVGTTAGVRPNHYGDHGEFNLPNSNLRISYSTRFHRFGSDADTAIVPDKLIESTWAEFLAGRDPSMEWIETYKE